MLVLREPSRLCVQYLAGQFYSLVEEQVLDWMLMQVFHIASKSLGLPTV